MKKILFAAALLIGANAFVACNGSYKASATAADSTAVDTVAVDTTVVDSVSVDTVA